MIRTRTLRLLSGLFALTLLPSCGASDSGQTSSSPAASSAAPASPSTSVAAAVTTPGPRTKNWFELSVGDCVTEIPSIDVGAVTTTVVDCAAPHQAEVYLLAPLAVNTAVADVANEKCTAGFVTYTGHAVTDSPYTVTYLIDSNQDRTADNPTPSTAICFLQAANGGPLTAPAHR